MVVYKGWRGDTPKKDGFFVSTYVGCVSDCGQWVDLGEVRHPMSCSWKETKAEAEAVLADEIERIGRRLIVQAEQLRIRAIDVRQNDCTS